MQSMKLQFSHTIGCDGKSLDLSEVVELKSLMSISAIVRQASERGMRDNWHPEPIGLDKAYLGYPKSGAHRTG